MVEGSFLPKRVVCGEVFAWFTNGQVGHVA